MVGVRGAPASKKSHRSSPVRNEVVRGAGKGGGGGFTMEQPWECVPEHSIYYCVCK